MNLVRLASEAVASADLDRPPRIHAVRVRVGELSGVVVEALEFAWDVARDGTICEHARLEIERVPARIRCGPCQTARSLVAGAAFRCPDCGTPSSQIIAGRELDLIELELGGDSALADEPSRTPAPEIDDVPSAAHP